MENELSEVLGRYKLKCCKCSPTGCCMNLVPTWSDSDTVRIQDLNTKINKIKELI